MWEPDYKESWASQNWCFWTVVLEKTLESPLECKQIQPVNPKGNQSWIFFGRTDAEAEIPILWPPNVKNWLIWKDPNAGKDWRWEEKGTTEDEMVGWHHWLNGHEFELTPGVGDQPWGLACCSVWGRNESDMTEWLNWTELNWTIGFKKVKKDKRAWRAWGTVRILKNCHLVRGEYSCHSGSRRSDDGRLRQVVTVKKWDGQN